MIFYVTKKKKRIKYPKKANLVVEVKKSILSFKNGSASGIDGFSPQYMNDIISKHTGDDGIKALWSLTRLVNIILSGEVNSDVCKYLYGASLCALEKKCGGIRPIAIGNFKASKFTCLKFD